MPSSTCFVVFESKSSQALLNVDVWQEETEVEEDIGGGVGVQEQNEEGDCAPVVKEPEQKEEEEEEIPQEPVLEGSPSPVVVVNIKPVFVPPGIARHKTVSRRFVTLSSFDAFVW